MPGEQVDSEKLAVRAMDDLADVLTPGIAKGLRDRAESRERAQTNVVKGSDAGAVLLMAHSIRGQSHLVLLSVARRPTPALLVGAERQVAKRHGAYARVR